MDGSATNGNDEQGVSKTSTSITLMPVYPPGFSERVFEFGFNSEYAAQNRAVLAAAPHIPTQNDEKALGYDIAFEIKRRGGGGAFNRSATQDLSLCRWRERNES